MTLSTTVGSVRLRSMILTAAGTSGYGDELAGYGDLTNLGAVVTKSLARFAFAGNPSPRVVSEGDDMLNAVGLAGPGVVAWREQHLVGLRRRGVDVVASIWGRSVKDYADAASDMAGADIVALEVNASCPNLEGRRGMFAHSAGATAEIVEASLIANCPLWVKLSPNTPDVVAIAQAAVAAGASAVVLVNTVLGMSIDIERRRPALGNGGGGVSGPGIFPVALRTIYDVRDALPQVDIVGVGGVSSGANAIAMVMAGARAVQVGTASFADPRAPWRIQREAEVWMARHGVVNVSELVGVAHG